MIGVIDCGWIVADTQRFQPPPTHADALATFVTSSGLPIELRWSKNTECTFRLKTTDDLFELSFRTRSWKCGALRRDGASLRRLDSLETKTFRLCRGFEASPQHNTSLRTGSFSFWKSAKVATRFFTLTLQWNTLLCQKNRSCTCLRFKERRMVWCPIWIYLNCGLYVKHFPSTSIG